MSTPKKYSTGNPMKDIAIMKGLTEIRDHKFPMTLDSIRDRCPDMDVRQEQFEGILHRMGGVVDAPSEAPPVEASEPTPEPTPEAAPVEAALVEGDLLTAAEPVAEAWPKMARDEANARLVRVNTALSQERGNVLSLTTRATKAREKLAQAIAAFQRGFAPKSREQLMREVIASNQQQKAEGVEAIRQSAPGPSVVDHAAYRGSRSVNRSYGRGYARPGVFMPDGSFRKVYPASAHGAKLPSEG